MLEIVAFVHTKTHGNQLVCLKTLKFNFFLICTKLDNFLQNQTIFYESFEGDVTNCTNPIITQREASVTESRTSINNGSYIKQSLIQLYLVTQDTHLRMSTSKWDMKVVGCIRLKHNATPLPPPYLFYIFLHSIIKS